MDRASVGFKTGQWGPFFFRLAVAKGSRHKGIGSRLVKEVEGEGILTTKGYREVYCLVKDNDTELKEYYTKRGFKEGDIPYRVMLKDIERR